MKHITEFRAGYDCIKFECKFDSKGCIPDKGGSHGKHGLSIAFIAKGDEGAVQFVLYTGWMPQNVTATNIGFRDLDYGSDGSLYPMPADLGYHSKKQQYEGQSTVDDNCAYCDGEPCYYDGSGLNASDAMYALCNGGDEGLWEFLDAYYECVFNDKEYPKPMEYPKDRRQ